MDDTEEMSNEQLLEWLTQMHQRIEFRLSVLQYYRDHTRTNLRFLLNELGEDEAVRSYCKECPLFQNKELHGFTCTYCPVQRGDRPYYQQSLIKQPRD